MKKYIIEVEHLENGRTNIKRINEGIPAFELLGLLTFLKKQVKKQIKKGEKVEGEFIPPTNYTPRRPVNYATQNAKIQEAKA